MPPDKSVDAVQQQITRKLLDFAKSLGVSQADLADGCLIAAAVSAAQANFETGMPFDRTHMEMSVVDRSQLFGEASLPGSPMTQREKGNGGCAELWSLKRYYPLAK